ncbi:MAG: hypothetical protein LBV26_05905 [Bacteroidales bacterium]|jgi:hypothetical protein|nr:hypothetical protein [Bacteroidales bacterium]
MKAIFFFLITILFVGCNKQCPPSAEMITPPIMYFSLTDSMGNDLFFGKDSIYNPHDVKLAYFDTSLYNISYDPSHLRYFIPFRADDTYDNCFKISVAWGRTSVFHIEFTPGNIDTIKIESRFDRYEGKEEEPDGIYAIYKERFFFNDSIVCEDCAYYRIYKIAVK